MAKAFVSNPWALWDVGGYEGISALRDWPTTCCGVGGHIRTFASDAAVPVAES